ncbi:hypothetical protein [Shewanella gelidii]|uniref:Peptidylprolyl isomerase n=1 Tax=Shewanella gelidii TaxID=1642821 RepID=A0A917N780_9GAMM|nr:hypothetical protein [Shewanella gelidii]MCL1097236.1 hypothetical protein [Shewanella gelidii]GGI73557.1 hypothetical protein GCM10009332_08810 [Shewanella gelidii]
MFNLKSVIAALVLSGTAVTASADEIVIDTSDLHETISAELAISMQEMQQQLVEDIDAILIAEYTQEDALTETELAD